MKIEDRLIITSIFSSLAMLATVEMLAIGMLSENEITETWALENLRAFGEMRKRQIEEGRLFRVEELDMLKRLTDLAEREL